jgi:hypothetical protein
VGIHMCVFWCDSYMLFECTSACAISDSGSLFIASVYIHIGEKTLFSGYYCKHIMRYLFIETRSLMPGVYNKYKLRLPIYHVIWVLCFFSWKLLLCKFGFMFFFLKATVIKKIRVWWSFSSWSSQGLCVLPHSRNQKSLYIPFR